jgi:hypothetical protein
MSAARVCLLEGCATPLTGRQAWFCSAAQRARDSRDEAAPVLRPCEECGESIVGRRADARWCSERCRSRYRARKRTEAGLEGSDPCQKLGCLPAQRGSDPWRCERCGAGVPPPFEVPA